MDDMLRIWVPFALILFWSLCYYDDGAHRVYDVILSSVALLVTSPLFLVFSIVGLIKTRRAFEAKGGELVFTFPKNRLNKLPALLLIFIGKKRALPARLRDIKF